MKPRTETSSKNTKRASAMPMNGANGINLATRPATVDAKQLLAAFRAFEQGDFSVADTLNQRNLLKALRKYEAGDFSVRLPEDQIGIPGEIARTFNNAVSRHESILKEFARINRVVGKEGKLSQRADCGNVPSGWDLHVKSFNQVIDFRSDQRHRQRRPIFADAARCRRPPPARRIP